MPITSRTPFLPRPCRPGYASAKRPLASRRTPKRPWDSATRQPPMQTAVTDALTAHSQAEPGRAKPSQDKHSHRLGPDPWSGLLQPPATTPTRHEGAATAVGPPPLPAKTRAARVQRPTDYSTQQSSSRTVKPRERRPHLRDTGGEDARRQAPQTGPVGDAGDADKPAGIHSTSGGVSVNHSGAEPEPAQLPEDPFPGTNDTKQSDAKWEQK